MQRAAGIVQRPRDCSAVESCINALANQATHAVVAIELEPAFGSDAGATQARAVEGLNVATVEKSRRLSVCPIDPQRQAIVPRIPSYRARRRIDRHAFGATYKAVAQRIVAGVRIRGLVAVGDIDRDRSDRL